MSSIKLSELHALVVNETLTEVERREAAERYVAEIVANVPVPSDDDEQVVRMRTAPPANHPQLDSHDLSAWRIWNEVRGWAPDGPTAAQAKKYVRERHQFRVVLGIVVDDSAHRLEKLAACQYILDDLHPRNFLRMNNFTAEKMLQKVLTADATKWTSSGEVRVERPPQTMADVW